jgi:hypothetical protein
LKSICSPSIIGSCESILILKAPFVPGAIHTSTPRQTVLRPREASCGGKSGGYGGGEVSVVRLDCAYSSLNRRGPGRSVSERVSMYPTSHILREFANEARRASLRRTPRTARPNRFGARWELVKFNRRSNLIPFTNVALGDVFP